MSGLRIAILAILVFAILYVSTILADRWPDFRRRIRYRNSRKWPGHQATIEERRIDAISTGFGRRYQAVLIYSYNIAGHLHSGCYRGARVRSRSAAEQSIAKYPVHSSVMARVNPERLEQSVLELPE